MVTSRQSHSFTLIPQDNRRLLSLCGQYNEHVQQIEKALEVTIGLHGYKVTIKGAKKSIVQAERVLKTLYDIAAEGKILNPETVHLYLQFSDSTKENAQMHDIKVSKGVVTAQGKNQTHYVQNILNHDINFAIGPAGTGKTYLAVAMAVNALEQGLVSRIILVRPIVEAGEKLGFLPGDLAQKVNPYLRPLYDALYEMMGIEKVAKLVAGDVIELAPLAYMRGRSLNDAFIILDEGQNTTIEQMKMFLTRIGFGSKVVITGDITQIDLEHNRDSGLKNSIDVLKGIEGISFTSFTPSDVVRHELVQSVVKAYAAYEKRTKGSNDS